MGKSDSSLTRVQPVFKALYKQDPFGDSWLRPLLAMAKRKDDSRSAALGPDIGRMVKSPQFELRVDPPPSFLAWLVRHPKRLTNPPK